MFCDKKTRADQRHTTQRHTNRSKAPTLSDHRTDKQAPTRAPTVSRQVISRFTRPGRGARILNRLPNNFTLSDDGTAATGQRGDQYLYATTRRRDEANNRLAAAQSAFRVADVPQGRNINYGGHTIRPLRVEIAVGAATPNGVTINANRVVTESPADCKRTAERVVGRDLHAHGHVTRGAGNIPAIERLVTLGRASNLTVANIQALVDMYINYFEANKRVSAFNQAYVAHRRDANQQAVIDVVLPSYRRAPAGYDLEVQPRVTVQTVVADIEQMFDHWMNIRNGYLQQLANLEARHNLNAAGQVQERKDEGMDKYADPDIGEAYVSLAGGVKRQGESYWNYHWGGVIMKTGTDNVTFENHASLQDPTRWDIRMYGRPKVVLPAPGAAGNPRLDAPNAQQSWHEIWSEHHFGDNPSTFNAK
ncbi:hypothetical protein [Vibrio sp. WXL103]|uniref:hypothetical protein n=1 Tax=Vibrio sp. WXL103 TaxID=3450710 RepID=UPI003EC512E8